MGSRELRTGEVESFSLWNAFENSLGRTDFEPRFPVHQYTYTFIRTVDVMREKMVVLLIYG